MAWTEIETQTLTTTAASVVFSTGLTGYKFFRLTGYWVSDASAGAVDIRLNNDSGANYAYQRIQAASTTVSGSRATGQTAQRLTPAFPDGSSFNSFSALIAKPAAGVKAQATAHVGFTQTSVAMELEGAEWNNTADLITRIDVIALSNNFAAGTSILLEGLSF